MQKWLKENVKLYHKVSIFTLPYVIAAQIIGIICFIFTYSVLKNSLYENGFWVIMSFYFGELIILLPYTFLKRNDPKHSVYYLFHLSEFSKLILILSLPLFFILFLYSQCSAFGLPINFACLRNIF